MDPLKIATNDLFMTESESYCTFSVRGTNCGVPVARVREIVCDQPITPVPLAHEAVTGLINLRGQILTVFDVRRWLRLEQPEGASAEHSSRFHLIVDLGREIVSLSVDEMGPVLNPAPHELEPIPANLDPEIAERITAAARMPDSVVLLMDLERLRSLDGMAVGSSEFGHSEESGKAWRAGGY